MKYNLYINGVWFESFKTLKEIDEYLYKLGFDNSSNDYNIEVKKLVRRKKKNENDKM